MCVSWCLLGSYLEYHMHICIHAGYLFRVNTTLAEVIRGSQDAFLDIRCRRQHAVRIIHVLQIVDP